MKYIKHLTLPIISFLCVSLMGWMLLSSESDVLYRMQELSLFLPTKLFFDTSTTQPGGCLTWAAAWCQQFFFHPATGVCLMMGMWAAIMLLCGYVFRLRRTQMLLTLLVPLALLACLTQTGYWIYYMKLQGHAFVPTLGVLVSLLLSLPIVRKETKAFTIWNFIWLAIVGIAGYPLLGAWSFLALGIIPFAMPLNKRNTAIAIVLALVFAAIMPQIYYQQIYTEVERECLYTAAMPCFAQSTEDVPIYRYAYYALALCFVLYACLQFIPARLKEGKRADMIFALAGLILVATASYGVNKRWYRDTNFHKEIVMTECIERCDWEGVLTCMLSNAYGSPMPPTRAMVMFKNLALFRLGRAGDEIFHYPEGCEKQHAEWTVKITQVGGKLLYYNYGKEGFCYRWCMEDGVEFGWSVNCLKYMAKTSLVTHDWEVAEKYLRILKQTRYHREWAEHYQQFVRHPELMEKDQEFIPILPMSVFTDRLDADNTLVELYLLRTFANGHGADKLYQENTLICAMLMKDIDLFWPRFAQYANMHASEEGFRVPTHYQEAAYLYIMLEPNRESQLWPGMTNAQTLSSLPFDQSIKDRYKAFMDFNTQCGSMSEEQKRVAFFPQFGDTFFYFYFLVRNQTTN